jgi:hypothetical protein
VIVKLLLCSALILCLVLPCTALEPASVITVFHIRDGTITPVSSQIVYGGSPNALRTQGEYIVATKTTAGADETQVWIGDPTLIRYLRVEEPEPSVEYQDDVDFTVVLPYKVNTAKVAVYDRDKKLLAETDLGSAKAAFCTAHSADERCRESPLNWGIGILLVLVIIGAGAFLILRRKKTGGN